MTCEQPVVGRECVRTFIADVDSCEVMDIGFLMYYTK